MPMEGMNQSKAEGKANLIPKYYNHVLSVLSCPNDIQIGKKYCRKLNTNIPKRTSSLIYIGFGIQSSLEFENDF